MVDIERAQVLLDDLCEALPPEFFRYLNGGISLLPWVKTNPVGAGLYIMGDYNRGSAMGRYINIYYGSFERVYPGATEEELKGHLREVLLHEFTHHLESLAGERGLEKKDQDLIDGYLRGDQSS